MNINTSTEYYGEISSLAEMMTEEVLSETIGDREAAEEIINDSRLHETIDGHQWVIYYAYNLDVLQYSRNDDYFEENIGGADQVLKDGGISQLHMVMAYWAMYADVQEYLDEAMDGAVADWEENHPDEEEAA